MRRLSAAQARRMALGAQGFTDPPPRGRVDVRHLRRVVERTGLLQIDSVSVLARAHYVPVFSRLGAYPTRLLDDLAYRRRELFEHWVHEASFAPVQLQPLLRHRMGERRPSRRMRTVLAERPGYLEAVLHEVGVRGPLAASDLAQQGSARAQTSWWGWSPGETALEHLFATGRLAVADRVGFARRYDLVERVLPRAVLEEPTPPRDEAIRVLVDRAARRLGVATAGDLADYHRLRLADASRAVDSLLRDGTLVAAQVDGWDRPAVVHRDAVVPRRVTAATVVSPFDPLVFCRPRLARLFAMDYRIEIYVPRERRRWGYYVLPVLVDDRLVARVDLAADRRGSRLRLLGAWWQPSADTAATTHRVAGALLDVARWQQLGDVAVAAAAVGDAVADLRRALRPAARAATAVRTGPRA